MILFNKKEKLFHLKNASLSCIITLVGDDENSLEPVMSYFGAPLPDDAAPVFDIEWNPHASHDSERVLLPYCVPTEGRGDYRPCMVAVQDEHGFLTTELYYAGHTIVCGKPALPGLPASYVESETEAETLTLLLRDPLTQLEASVSYTLFAAHPILAASMRLVNRGTQLLTLRNAASFTLSLPGSYDLLHLCGAWARERHVERVPACRMTRQIESARGASGHEHNPFVALLAADTTEFSGECFGVNLVYSGDFRVLADENAYGSTRLVTGLNPRTFCWKLSPGEAFQTPEALCAYSTEGLNGMSQAFHRFLRSRVCRGFWRDRERPILINNWEATYFDFDHEKLMSIARTAAQVGVELFVLDDGWFGRRDQDNCSLGDWIVDRRKLPNGLRRLAEEINALGLGFGLWLEPEMVSPDSELYRAHPDWCLHVPGRRRTTGRNQLVLDLSRQDVQDYLISAVAAVLESAPISYVKWDMNRNFKETGSALLTDGHGGELHHRYMLGVYRVMEAITGRFPQILFESCAGGGGRFDAGMLYYMPQTWTSDDTDAMERLKIQYGTSIAYPACAMGAHVSAIPNHQVARMTPIRTRGEVAAGGNFGFELDLSRQSPEDLAEIRRQVALVKSIRRTTQQGDFTRLLSPFEGNVTAWQFADDTRVILCVYRVLAQPNPGLLRVRLHGLPEDAAYRAPDGSILSAAQLMHAGIVLPLEHSDFASCMMIFERI